jgi:hypothetical protein
MKTENDTKGTDIQKWDYSIILYKNNNIQIQNSIIRDLQQYNKKDDTQKL